MAILTCEHCGRLLNRATGECPVHGVVLGLDPEARELTPAEAMKEMSRLSQPQSETPSEATAEPDSEPEPVKAETSSAAAPASPKPARMQLAASAPAIVASKPSANGSSPGAIYAAPHRGQLPAAAVPPAMVRMHVGALGGLRCRGKAVQLYAFQGAIVIARAKGGHLKEREHLSPGQLVALDPANELFENDQVIAIDVWERWPGGMLTVTLAKGRRRLSWRGKALAEADVETTLNRAFLGRVDQAPTQTARQIGRFGVPLAVVVGVIIAAVVVGNLLKSPPPRPPVAVATPTTLSAQQQQLLDTLSPVCPAWKTFAAAQTRGLPPDRTAMKAAITPMGGPLNQAVTIDGTLTPAEQQAPYLLGWATKPVDEANREPVARLFDAIDIISATCRKART